MDGDALDEALRALSHPDRRMFIRACLSEELSAGDLAALSRLSAASVSEHLKVLRKSELLRLNRSGRFWMYRTNESLLGEIVSAINAIGVK